MTFLQPVGLVGLIGVPILILIYILKRRYREETVPSTFLWRRSLAYMKRSLPWSLRNSVLLALQLAGVIVFSLMLARPTVAAPRTGEKIVVLDASAGMSADGADGRTRFARALELVDKLADKADGNHRVTVILAGDTASYAVYRSDDKNAIRDVLKRLSCGLGGCDLDSALQLAERAKEENTEAEIRLYTDVEYDEAEGLTVVDVRQTEWNAAALGLTATSEYGKIRFSGTVASYGGDATLTAMLYVDGELKGTRRVSCQNGVGTQIDFREVDTSVYTYAEIRVLSSDGHDALPGDDTYTLYAPTSTQSRVEVVYASGAPNVGFLKKALENRGQAFVKSVALTADYIDSTTGREKYGVAKGSRVSYSGYDVYVFCGVLPAVMPTDGAVWFVNPPACDFRESYDIPLTLGEEQTVMDGQQVYLAASVQKDPKYAVTVDKLLMNEVSVNCYTPIGLSSGDDAYHTLLSAGGETVVAAGMRGFTPVVVWSLKWSEFELQLSDYPLFVKNLLTFSRPDVLGDRSYTIGATAEIRMPAGSTALEVLCNGTPVDAADAQDISYTFRAVGDYEFRITATRLNENGVEEERTLSYYAFVGIDPAESDLYPHDGAVSAYPVPDGLVTKSEPTEVWQYFLIALLLILTAEWWVYYRV